MSTSHGRRIQGRRALAILSWLTLAVVAGLLWYAQEHDWISVQAWEPAAIVLSAYCAFLGIFGWLLFSPERASAEESPGIFFGGMLTLLPPAFIAYHLMPVDSPLKGWVTLVVFVLGLIAILSPLPKEVFALPRDRRSYRQPLTDSYLTTLDTNPPQVAFESLLPKTQFRLTQPADRDAQGTSSAHDPWRDPFLGTGRQLSRIGVSRSRRADVLESPDGAQSAVIDGTDVVPSNESRSVGKDLDDSFTRYRPRAEAITTNRTPVPQPPPVPLDVLDARTPPPLAAPVSRRPLTEPGDKPASSIGFQRSAVSSPVVPAPVLSSPLVSVPLPVNLPPVLPPVVPVQRVTTTVSQAAAAPSLYELDRQLRAMEDDDDSEQDTESLESSSHLAMQPVAGVSRSGPQSVGDATYERITDERGGEMIEGTIPVRFEIGQKRAHLHVPFTPALRGVPDVECEPVGDDSIRLKVAVRQPYGIRIEARRSEAADTLETDISFSAVYTPSHRG